MGVHYIGSYTRIPGLRHTRPATPPPPPPPPPRAPVYGADVYRPAPPAPPSPFQFPGIGPGTRLNIVPGTSVQGYSIDGSAMINRFDGRTLDLTLDASAFSFVKVRANVRAEVQPDGTVRARATELGRDGQPKKVYFDDTLQIVSSRPGELILRTPDGQHQGAIRADAAGNLTIEHPKATLRLERG